MNPDFTWISKGLGSCEADFGDWDLIVFSGRFGMVACIESKDQKVQNVRRGYDNEGDAKAAAVAMVREAENTEAVKILAQLNENCDDQYAYTLSGYGDNWHASYSFLDGEGGCGADIESWYGDTPLAALKAVVPVKESTDE